MIHAMALHWAEDPIGQLIQCARALRPDGLLIATLLGGETLSELRTALTNPTLMHTLVHDLQGHDPGSRSFPYEVLRGPVVSQHGLGPEAAAPPQSSSSIAQTPPGVQCQGSDPHTPLPDLEDGEDVEVIPPPGPCSLDMHFALGGSAIKCFCEDADDILTSQRYSKKQAQKFAGVILDGWRICCTQAQFVCDHFSTITGCSITTDSPGHPGMMRHMLHKPWLHWQTWTLPAIGSAHANLYIVMNQHAPLRSFLTGVLLSYVMSLPTGQLVVDSSFPPTKMRLGPLLLQTYWPPAHATQVLRLQQVQALLTPHRL